MKIRAEGGEPIGNSPRDGREGTHGKQVGQKKGIGDRVSDSVSVVADKW